MGFTGTVSIFAMKDGDYFGVNFAGTTTGLQAAVDYLAGGKGKVWVGPGTLLTSTAIWLHSGCHLQGAGVGQTIIKRNAMANGDAVASGAVISSSQYGANGTRYSAATSGSNIIVSDLTVDGNQSTFAGLTDGNLLPAGIAFKYVDGVTITNVAAQNCLGDGFRAEFCRNVTMSNVSTNLVGQWAQVQARNAINFIGDYAGSGAWGYNYSLTGANLVNTGDEAIQASNITLMTIVDVSVDGCDFVFECAPAGSTTAGTFTDWTISDITAVNVLDYFFTWAQGQGTGYTVQDVTISNCTISGHATLHDGGVFSAPAVTGFYLNRISISNCEFRQVNMKDTNSHVWVDFQGQDSTGFDSIRFHGCSFFGKNGSTRVGDHVFNIRGQNSNWQISDCIIKDVAGTGIRVNDTSVSVQTVSDIIVSNVTINGINEYGIRVTCSGGSGTLKDLHFLNCIVKDSNKQTSGSGIQLFINQAGATIQRVFVRGCRVYKSSGTTLTFGLSLVRTTGTVDEITIENCDFSQTATGWMSFDAGATNVRFTPRSGRGTDITAAATIIIPPDGTLFHVIGNTNITNGITLNAWDNGRTAILVFEGTPTVSDTGTSNLNGNFVAAGTTNGFDTLTLSGDNVSWNEVARSAN